MITILAKLNPRAVFFAATASICGIFFFYSIPAWSEASGCDLVLTHTAGQTQIQPGDSIDYTITLKNIGTDVCTGQGVTLKDTYNPNVMFVSSAPAATAGNDTWNFGTLFPGDERTVNISVASSANISQGTTITNKACAWAWQYGPHDNPASWQCSEALTTVGDALSDDPPVAETRVEDITFSAVTTSSITIQWTSNQQRDFT